MPIGPALTLIVLGALAAIAGGAVIHPGLGLLVGGLLVCILGVDLLRGDQ